jgi:hypothetical protein
MPGAGNKRSRRGRRSRWFDDLIIEDEDPIQALVDRALDSHKANAVFEKVKEFIDRAGNAIDPKGRPVRAPASPRAPASLKPNPHAVARAILHFGPREQLTKEIVTKRRRALATVCHPDKGGSSEAMVRLNQAADLLLSGIEKGLY